MLHKEIPFLRIGVPVGAGIVSGLYFNPDIIFLITAFVIIVAGFLISIAFNKYQNNQFFGCMMTFALFISGNLLYRHEKNSLSELKPVSNLFTCTLSEYPEEKDKTYRMIVKLSGISEEKSIRQVKGSLLIYIKKDSSVNSMLPGDMMMIRLTPVEIKNNGNPCEFDYRFFMENQGIKYYAFINANDITKTISPVHRKPVYKALIIREKIINMFSQRGIKGERLALLAAITLGQKRMLDPEQKLNFIKAGVMHIMAVSGLHAIILSLFIYNLLFFLKGRLTPIRAVITIVILWGFTFITGLTPSVLRATMMYSFLQSGKLLRRPVNGINSVIASAVFLMIARPSVLFDAGFLLSYSAVIYIICFYNNLYGLINIKNQFTDKIWQSAAVTVIAQAGTLPLTVMLFNRFPTYFIIANITIVPLSDILIVAGCLIPLLFPLYGVSHLIAIALGFMTGLTETMTAFAASLPCSTIENIGFTVPECILLSITIFLFLHFFLKRKVFPIYVPVIFLALFVAAGTFKSLSLKKTHELIVYKTQKSSTVGLRSGKMLYIYSDTSENVSEVKRHSSTLGLRIIKPDMTKEVSLLKAGNEKILIAGYVDNRLLQNTHPDILILKGKRPEIREKLNREYVPALIIFAEANENRSFYRLINTGIDSLYFVNKSGAFIRRL